MTSDRSRALHAWHVWMNERDGHESSLYEFKNMLGELRRLPGWFRRERCGELPTVHRQCSLSPDEPIVENKLTCALGIECAKCEILKELRAVLDREEVLPEEQDRILAETCCWHLFMCSETVDTSEGYVLHEGDRMYWERVYASLAYDPDEPEEG